ncbi:hypothetical protein [Microbacterium sp. SS28]|uniref:hypothetical protein n=1 Tax=Microbacterium sp. SS28 TaxID=2919948 RepID=UPI001FA9A356|nr:hypothetical protein [Microbacterium sp. SS28]
MRIRSANVDDRQFADPSSRASGLGRRLAVGSVTLTLILTATVFAAAPGSAAPKPRPKPTPTATATPVPPPPTSSPTPIPPSPAPVPPSPTLTPPPTPSLCESTTTYGTVEYCVTTFTAISTGRHAVGTRVAVGDTFVLEVNGDQVILGSTYCPPGMYCGATIATLLADFSHAQPTPAVDSTLVVYGTMTADMTLLVDTYQ